MTSRGTEEWRDLYLLCMLGEHAQARELVAEWLLDILHDPNRGEQRRWQDIKISLLALDVTRVSAEVLSWLYDWVSGEMCGKPWAQQLTNRWRSELYQRQERSGQF